MNDSKEDSQIDLDVSRIDCDVDVIDSLADTNDLKFTLEETMALKKNLSSAFEEESHRPSTANSENEPVDADSVAAKIAMYEKKGSSRDLSAQKIAPSVSAAVAAKVTSMGVFLRVRPLPKDEINTIEILREGAQGQLSAKRTTSTTTALPTLARTHPPTSSSVFQSYRGDLAAPVKEFVFSGVFSPQASQSSVYHSTVQPLLAGLTDHQQSALVFSYGITNAGKTYTVAGPENPKSEQSWGLIPRALEELLRLSRSKKLDISLSYYEIYKEQIFDLLAEDNLNNRRIGANRPALNVSEGIDVVRGLSKHTFPDLRAGLALISQAQKMRRTGTNSINTDSSRSHGICQISVAGNDGNLAHLWIVDLAGSERSKRTGGHRLQEAADINKSLMTLNRCLTALRSNQGSNGTAAVSQAVVPYRDSKLTQLFGHHWSSPWGNRTTMIVNVNPSVADFDESQHVLAYATSAKTLQLSSKLAVAPGATDEADTSATATASKIEYGYDGRRKRARPTPRSRNGISRTVKSIIKKLSPKRKPHAASARIKASSGSRISQSTTRHTHSTIARKRKVDGAGNRIHSKSSRGYESDSVCPSKASSSVSSLREPSTKRARQTHDSSSHSAHPRIRGTVGSTGSATVKSRPPLARSISSSNLAVGGSHTMMATSSTSAMNTFTTSTGSSSTLLMEQQHLQTKLLLAEAEIAVLKEKNADWEEECAAVENEVRTEVAEEMDQQMQEMREQYEEIVDDLKAKVRSHTTMDKSIRKLEANHNEERLEELMLKVDECEDEMVRMRDEHEAEFQDLQNKFTLELDEKDQEIASLKNALSEQELRVQELSNQLQQERNTTEQEMENDVTENQQQKEEEDDDDVSVHEDDKDVQPSVGHAFFRQDESRLLTENVASHDFEGTNETDSQGGSMMIAKNRREEKIGASPRPILGVLSNNKRPARSTRSTSSVSSTDTFGPDLWLLPKKGPKRDPSTGKFKRPKGRAPSGTSDWDEDRGAWHRSSSAFLTAS